MLLRVVLLNERSTFSVQLPKSIHLVNTPDRKKGAPRTGFEHFSETFVIKSRQCDLFGFGLAVGSEFLRYGAVESRHEFQTLV